MHIKIISLSVYLYALSFSSYLYSAEFVLAIEHNNDKLYEYPISLLKLALEHGQDRHSLKIIEYPMLSHGRLFDEMLHKDTHNIVISGLEKTRIQKAHLVKVPVSRGLLGHRLFVIKKQNFELMKSVNSLEALIKHVSVGSGYGWIDTKVFKSSGFRVDVASFSQLWEMLDKGRFIGFNRGLHEAFSEVELFSKQYPDIMVYPHIIVQYKFDYFFYTKNARLRNILERKLSDIYANGLFMRHFNSHPQIKKAFENLNFENLSIYALSNHYLPAVIHDIPRSYWHDIKQSQ